MAPLNFERFFPGKSQTLPGYTRNSSLASMLKNSALILALIVVGLIYGFLAAVFPYWFYLYLALPLGLLVGLVVWVLPAAERYPSKVMKALFWAFLVSLLAWPNYLAIAIPGLPWITIQRLLLAPLTLLFLVSVSISTDLRNTLNVALGRSKSLTLLMLAFVAVQLLTTAFSDYPAMSLNRLINNQLAWTTLFFVAVWIFLDRSNVRRFYAFLTGLTVFACLIAGWEWYLQRVPWAGHIPSFLAVDDERIQQVLFGTRSRAGTEQYRVAGTFITPLNLAQFLGLATAFVIHALVTAKTMRRRIALTVFLPVLFLVILSTGSRLGALAFFVSGFGYLFTWLYLRWRADPKDLFGIAATVAAPFFAGAFLTLSIVWNRLNSLIWGSGNGDTVASTEARRQQLELFWPKIQQWPFGYGTGRSGEVLGWYSPGGVLSIDSYPITIALDYGLIGFCIFYGILVITMIYAWQHLLSQQQGSLDALPIAIMVPVFILVKTVLSQDNEHSLIFIAIGLVIGLRYHSRARVV